MAEKKLSGYEYRKRKAEKEERDKAELGKLQKVTKFFKSVSSPEVAAAPTATSSSNAQNENNATKDSDIVAASNEAEIFEQNDKTLENVLQNDSQLLGGDPESWPLTISQIQKSHLISLGPSNPNDDYEFPQTEGRKFTKGYFLKKLDNGETIKRSWLVYSAAADKVYCFACKLFGTNQSSSLSSLGSCDWKHLSETLIKHERSPGHTKNCLDWMEARKRIATLSGVDSALLKRIEEEKKKWRNIFKRILEVVRFLSSRNLAFQGSSDKLQEIDNGNFLGTIELLAKFDSLLETHLNSAMLKSSKGSNPHYFSHEIQNEFIQIMSKKMLESIVTEVKAAKYYSIILDCTPDVSHKEQMSICFRYVNVQRNPPEIFERFIGFVPVEDKTGEGLTETILNQLTELGLDIQNIRGQAYDNGSNMKGNIRGVQRRILNINQRAFFIACANHTCNLTLSDGAKSSTSTITFFGTIQKFYNFASGSTNRWDIFKKHATTFSLKPLSTTRWESRIESLKPLRYQISQVRDALEEIGESKKFDSNCRFEATCLVSQIEKFEFLVLLSAWFDILHRLNVVSKMIQGPKIDVSATLELIKQTEDFLSGFKNTGFESAQITANQLGTELGLEEKDMKFEERRSKRRKFQIPENSATTGLEKFRIHCFDPLVNSIHESMAERFQEMKSTLSDFQILCDSNLRKLMTKPDLLKNCKDLQIKLSDDKGSDIDGSQLCEEFLLLKGSFPATFGETPFNILAFIMTNGFEELFPNLWVTIRIFLTIPVSVASCERSFSKLKLIKNYLRSTMSQERLAGLAILAIEKELAKELDFDSVIDEFSAQKSRKVLL